MITDPDGPVSQSASGARQLTERQRRARDLEFRSFALLAVGVMLGVTGVGFFVFEWALPLLSGPGLVCAVAAWRMHDRRPRLVAPLLATTHASALVLLLYFFARKSGLH